MKVGTARFQGSTRAFAMDAAGTRYFSVADVGELLATPNWHDLTSVIGDSPDDSDLTLPILKPGKIICAGLNYHEHAAEVGKTPPDVPTLFSKVATTLVANNEPIMLPTLSDEIDWECELAIVIGTSVRNADDASARAAIFGYTILNDISARDWQRRTSEWFQGKNFDSTAPFGPIIVTADEFDPTEAFAIECRVDAEIRQQGLTSDMIFSPVDLVKYVSQFLTLEPGDVIATGTPAGVGSGRKPPLYLSEGEIVTSYIEGIGTLTNTCLAEAVSATRIEVKEHR